MKLLSVVLGASMFCTAIGELTSAQASFIPPVCSEVQGPASRVVPPPIRGSAPSVNKSALNLSNLGFTQESDGSWSCWQRSSVIPRGRYTAMTASVDGVNGYIMAASFFENGKVVGNQNTQTVRYFLEMATRYSDLPAGERINLERYFTRVLTLIESGELSPSGEVNVVDKPAGLLFSYLPQGDKTALIFYIPVGR